MKVALYPGSFDPITKGHLDIIERAAKITDKLIVAVLVNDSKTPLFSIEKRVFMIKESIKHLPNVEVDTFDGLLVDFAKSKKVNFIIRGLRAVTDFEYELQLAQTNRQLDANIDTMFFLTNINYSYLSSSVVKEIAKNKGDVSKFVTKVVEKELKNYYKGNFQ